MATLKPSFLRHVCESRAPLLRGTQRRWAQVHDVRFVATHLEPDRVIEKYREKLDKKSKEQGLRDIYELKDAYKDKIQAMKRKASSIPISQVTASSKPTTSNPIFPSPPPPPQPIQNSPKTSNQKASSGVPGIKTLSSYIDVPKTMELPREEIEYIWRLRHASDPQSLCAVVPHSIYRRIEATAKRHPQFILPLPREGQGAEIHFLQWTFPTPTTATVLFTHLAEYKLRGEFSQPHTTVTHHLDLAGPKELVLLQGSVVEGRGVTVDEGKWLLMCLQKFYGRQEEKVERKKLLQQFSQGDQAFKISDLLEEAEKIV